MPARRYNKNVKNTSKKRSQQRGRARQKKWMDEHDDDLETVILSEPREIALARTRKEFISVWTKLSDWDELIPTPTITTLAGMINNYPTAIDNVLRDHQAELFGLDVFDFTPHDEEYNSSSMRRLLMACLDGYGGPPSKAAITETLLLRFESRVRPDALDFFIDNVREAFVVDVILKRDSVSPAQVRRLAKRLWRKRQTLAGQRYFIEFCEYLVKRPDVSENMLRLVTAARLAVYYRRTEFISLCLSSQLQHVFGSDVRAILRGQLETLFSWSENFNLPVLRFVRPSTHETVLSHMERTSRIYLPSEIANVVLQFRGRAPLCLHTENVMQMALQSFRQDKWQRPHRKYKKLLSMCFKMAGDGMDLKEWKCRTRKDVDFMVECMTDAQLSATTIAKLVLSSYKLFKNQPWKFDETPPDVFREMGRMAQEDESLPVKFRMRLCPNVFVAHRFPAMRDALIANGCDENDLLLGTDCHGRNLLFAATSVADVRRILSHVRRRFGDDAVGADQMVSFVNATNCWGMSCVDEQWQWKRRDVAEELTNCEFWRGGVRRRSSDVASETAGDAFEQRRSRGKRRGKKNSSGKARSETRDVWKKMDKKKSKRRRLDVCRKRDSCML